MYFFSCAGTESASAGDAPADRDHLIEDGDDGEDSDSTEPITKEEAAERLLVRLEVYTSESRLM